MASFSEADDYQPHLGKAVYLEEAEKALVLVSVETGPQTPGPRSQPFSLIFEHPKPGPLIAEGLYTCRVENQPIGRLYLIPIHTPRPDVQAYQAVFN